jgi:DNA polymerase-3 subunit delta'
MLFSDVIGQQDVKRHLAEMIGHNRLSHALLFTGKEGSGALPLAIAFAQYVMCEKVNGKLAPQGPSLFGEGQPQAIDAPSEACGVCNSCKKAGDLVHPDIHFSYPVIPKKPGDKPVSTDFAAEWREFIAGLPYGNVYDWLQFIGAENRQGNITAQECNDIIHKLSLKSFESEYKILVLWMPEYLGTEGNKLLKLIEEPPANTLFILVAENETMVLPTIVSRTQLVRIPPIAANDIEQVLVAKGKMTKEQARQIASVSGGNYRESLQVIQHAGEDWQSLIRDWLNAIMKSGPVAQVKWIEEMSKHGREKQKQFLRYFNHLLGQAIKIQVMPRTDLPIPDNEKDFALRLNKMAGIEQQQAIIEELDKAAYYIERNANAKLLFHALTIKLYHIIADKSLILIT